MNFLLKLFIKTCIETLSFTGIIILAGLILEFFRNFSMINFQKSFGNKVVMVTGYIGVPIHELSHAAAALIFRHNITAIKLIQRPDADGVMGYVEHTYDQHSIYQQIGNFFIGIAPILGGIGTIIVLMHFFIPDTYRNFIYIMNKNIHIEAFNKYTIIEMLNSYMEFLKSIFSINNFKDCYFYIFLFLSICICSHISLSQADIKGATGGFSVIFILFFIFNLFGLNKYISEFNIVKYNLFIVGFLVVAIIFSLITFLISLMLLVLRRGV